MENTEALKAKVKSAMRYPTFIAGFVVMLLIGILWKLVPVFEQIYGSFGASLPLPTMILITLSHIIQHYIIIIIPMAIGAIFLIRYLLTFNSVKMIVDTYILKVSDIWQHP